MSAAKHTPQPTAKFVLSIDATTGYQSTTEGTCTPDQYGDAMAALHGKRTSREDDLLEALLAVLGRVPQDLKRADPAMNTACSQARAAINKATWSAS